MLTKSKSKKINSTALASKAVYEKGNARLDYLPDGFIVDNSLSSKKVLTLYNPNSKEVITSFRGSQGEGDWKQNMKMVIGLEKFNKDYKNSLKNTKKVKDKYKDYDVTVTGHSKGGRNAISIGQKLGLKVDSYDAPSSLLDFNPKNVINNSIKKDNKTNIYSTAGDPVGFGSLVTGKGNKQVIISKTGNVHSIDNYL